MIFKNIPADENELMTLSKEEEEFLLKYRKLTKEGKVEIKTFISAFDDDSEQ